MRTLLTISFILSLFCISCSSMIPADSNSQDNLVSQQDPWAVPELNEATVVRIPTSNEREFMCRYSCSMQVSFSGAQLKEKTTHYLWQQLPSREEKSCSCPTATTVAKLKGCPINEAGLRATVEVPCSNASY